MRNKKSNRSCIACPTVDCDPETQRWERVSFLNRQLHKSSTGNLAENLQTILHQNRSKRKLGFLTLEMEHSPSSRRLTERNRLPQNNLPPATKISNKSSLQATLKELKQRCTESKCKVNRHENAKLLYLCLQPNCKDNRLGCAHCFVGQHESHHRIKCQDFLRKFTNGYLDYLGHFSELLKCISAIKHKQEESLNIELTHLRQSFNLSMQKLEHNLKAELRERLNASLVKQQHVLERSTDCMNFIAELEDDLAQNHPFSQKLSTLVTLDYESVNESLKGSLAELKNLRSQDFAAELRQHVHSINGSISDLFFNEALNKNLKQVTQQAKYDSLSAVDRLSVHSGLQSLQRVQLEPVQTNGCSQPAWQESLKKCPCTDKIFLNPQADLTEFSGSEGINTLTLFACCSGRFCCSGCHNQARNHIALQTNPSERVCSVCQQIFEVPFGNSIPINCRTCLSKFHK